MRPKITYSFIHSFKTRHKSDRPVRVQLAQRWQLLSAGCSTSDLRFHSTGLAATSPAEERQSLHRLLSLVQGSLPQFMRFHLVFACIFYFFFYLFLILSSDFEMSLDILFCFVGLKRFLRHPLSQPSAQLRSAQVSNLRDRWSHCCAHAVAIKPRRLAPVFLGRLALRRGSASVPIHLSLCVRVDLTDLRELCWAHMLRFTAYLPCNL